MPFVNNLVLLEGFLAGETKRIGDNGPAVGQISVSKRIKDKETREYVTKYEYFDIKGWGEARDKMAGLSDGMKIILSGQLDRESWEDKETKKTIYKTVVLVNTIAELPKIGGQDGPQELPPPSSRSKPANQEWAF